MAPLRDLGPDLPADLAGVGHRMLAKDPAERYATPAEVAEALEPYAIGGDLPALLGRTSSPSTRLRSASRPLPPKRAPSRPT